MLFSVDLHAAELKAVGVCLMVWGQVVVVEDTDPKHSGVHASAQEEDCDETCHLKDKSEISAYENWK